MTTQELKVAVYEAIEDYFNHNKTVSQSEASRITGLHRNTIRKYMQMGKIETSGGQVLNRSLMQFAHDRDKNI
jgi:hypothetical protein